MGLTFRNHNANKMNYRYFNPLQSPGSKGPQAHTFFKTLYENFLFESILS